MRWLIGLATTVTLLRLALVLSVLAAAGCGSPTDPNVPTHPNEIQAAAFVDCMSPGTKTAFSDNERKYPEDDCRQQTTDAWVGDCLAAAWLLTESNTVVFWRPWLRAASRTEIREAAAHEITHLHGFGYRYHDASFYFAMGALLQKEDCR